MAAKYWLVRIAYILSLPSLWIVSLVSGVKLAELSHLFAAMTQKDGFKKWMYLQISCEGGFDTELARKNKNFTGMRPNGRISKKEAFGFQKYLFYVDCSLDLLMWYEDWGQPVQKAVSNGFQITDLPAIIQLLKATKYIIPSDVVGYANNIASFFSKYKNQDNLIYAAEGINLVTIFIIIYYWKRVKSFTLRYVRKIRNLFKRKNVS